MESIRRLKRLVRHFGDLNFLSSRYEENYSKMINMSRKLKKAITFRMEFAHAALLSLTASL